MRLWSAPQNRSSPTHRPARAFPAYWVTRRSGHRRERRPSLFSVLFGCGNFGNDGSLEAILNLLRHVRPDARLTCICANPDLIRDRFDVSALPISAAHIADAHGHRPGGWARKIVEKFHDVLSTIRSARKFDLVLIPGTGILDDFGDRPKGMPWNILRWCLVSRLLGAKVAFVCVGAGPIGHPLSRWMMKTAGQLAHYRSYRDVLSKDFMTSIGVKTGADPVFADLAFGLPPPLHRERPDAERLVVGVGVMSYYGWYSFAEAGAETHRQYIDKLAKFCAPYLGPRASRPPADWRDGGRWRCQNSDVVPALAIACDRRRRSR